MNTPVHNSVSGFVGPRLVASGDLIDVARETKEYIDRGHPEPVLLFDDLTGRQLEIDWRGTAYDVVGRLLTQRAVAAAPKRPGRPKLGVVAREITLLPRHWEWLSAQPGGASVALRKLVDQARRANEGDDQVRDAQEAAYRFMNAMAGNERGFEEATRALFARDRERFLAMSESWPRDVRAHALRLADRALKPAG